MTANDPRLEEIASKYNIPEPYDDSHPAVQEADGIEVDVEDELDDRVDLRGMPAFTVDPDDAKDYDDAITIEQEDDGYRAYVHIADVSHYVEQGSELDQAAKDRGVTFYLGENTRHMFPEELASDICSLVEGEDRLAHTVEMELGKDFNGDYEIQDFDIYESVIQVDEGLSYTEADHILENGDESYDDELLDQLDLADDLTQDIRDDRWEYSLIINNDESPSSRVVEEMMLKANQAVARHLLDAGKPGIYRVEDHPDPEWEEEVEEDLAEEGYTKQAGWLSEADNPKKKLNEFFEQEINEEDDEEVKKAVITKMKPAEYSTRDDTHFALDFEKYAQFTSPIRRVGDLVNHRMVKRDPPEDSEEFLREIERVQDVVGRLNQRHASAKQADRAYDRMT
ncbi:MAG: ribonuclease catalytic domain-containing protein [Candidatus Nanohaloarchaea archaeon]|nr:ribonuclease catalytic domain-containing protein [Candidatus Nanohaloarchaea archaeon]